MEVSKANYVTVPVPSVASFWKTVPMKCHCLITASYILRVSLHWDYRQPPCPPTIKMLLWFFPSHIIFQWKSLLLKTIRACTSEPVSITKLPRCSSYWYLTPPLTCQELGFCFLCYVSDHLMNLNLWCIKYTLAALCVWIPLHLPPWSP